MSRKTYQEWVDTYSEIDFSKHEPTSTKESIYITIVDYEVNGDKYRLLKSKSGGDNHTVQTLKTSWI
jgi:hypothetical protein